jgi:hypothetical protein
MLNRHLDHLTQIILTGVLSIVLAMIVTAQTTRPVSQGDLTSKDKEAGEVELALAAIGSGSAHEINSRLFTDRITIFDDEIRKQALALLPATLHNQRIIKSKLFARVDLIFRQALQLHGRTGQLELFLYPDAIPSAKLWRGCILMLSDGLADSLYDSELAGVIAHELGHGYFEDEVTAAQRAQDTRSFASAPAVSDLISAEHFQEDNAPYSCQRYVKDLEIWKSTTTVCPGNKQTAIGHPLRYQLTVSPPHHLLPDILNSVLIAGVGQPYFC